MGCRGCLVWTGVAKPAAAQYSKADTPWALPAPWPTWKMRCGYPVGPVAKVTVAL
jgi:hypothetical protein